MAHREMASVEAWVVTRASSLEAPVHVHFDELFDGYSRAAAVDMAHDVMAVAVRSLGPRLSEVKPVVALPLRATQRFSRRAPEIGAVASLLDAFQPPSLTLVRRDSYGRIAMLMEHHQVPLRIDREPEGGAVVWSYRTWLSGDDGDWSRSIAAEHWLEIGPGQELRGHD